MSDMLMDVDMRKRDSMLEFLEKHSKHGDFNSPEAYSHDVRIRDIIKSRNREKAYRYFDEVFAFFEELVREFERKNTGLKIFQTGRSGGHIELYEEVLTKVMPVPVVDKRDELYGIRHDMESLREIAKKVKTFDDFYEELVDKINQYLDEIEDDDDD